MAGCNIVDEGIRNAQKETWQKELAQIEQRRNKLLLCIRKVQASKLSKNNQ